MPHTASRGWANAAHAVKGFTDAVRGRVYGAKQTLPPRTRKPPHRLLPVGGEEALNPGKGASVQNLPEQTELQLASAHPADPLGVYDHHAYLPWEFIHFNLPYRRPAEPIWTRTNSNATFEVVAGRIQMPDGTVDRFVPYGKQARAALLWMCTEAKLTSSPTLELGNSYNTFLSKLGIGARTASRGGQGSTTTKATLAQLRSLFAATISVSSDDEDPDGRVHLRDFGYRLTSASSLWFSHREAADVEGLFPSTVTLSSELFGSIIERGNPVNLEGWRAIQATSKSPLALDVYVWLCSRLWGIRGVARPSWDQLLQQFGAQTSRKEFVRMFKAALDTAVKHYPEARVAERFDARGRSAGLELRPSPPAVAPRDSR